jgi:hypothetical protein
MAVLLSTIAFAQAGKGKAHVYVLNEQNLPLKAQRLNSCQQRLFVSHDGYR